MCIKQIVNKGNLAKSGEIQTMKKRITIAVVVIVVIVAGVLFFRSKAQSAAQDQFSNLQTEEASIGSLTARVGATGTVRASQTTNLSWKR